MIVGLFLRHYKAYENLNFISFMHDSPTNLNTFIGPNGAGKSSLLEALDCVFNDREWNVTVGQKKTEANICPVFLIEKEKISDVHGMQHISNFFWETDFSLISQTDVVRSFSDFRDKLKSTIDTSKYYLVSAGVNYKGDVIFTSTFHNKLFNTIKIKGVSKDILNDIKGRIYSLYSYIYIPVETNIANLLSLQAREFQALMDKNIINGITSQLDNKNIDSDGGPKVSIVNIINGRLDSYIEEINKRVSAGYTFAVNGARKKTIKSKDVVGTIIQEYFNIRPLVKDNKKVSDLSSGEQRLALMDVISSLLQTKNETTKDVVLAIDEPEGSLHPAVCFSQFKRLFDLATIYDRQVFITTHWYGLLLVPVDGCLQYVSCNNNGVNTPEIQSFNLKNIHEYRKAFPESVEMKSFFDLVSSMFSILMNSEHNWLICEGSEDSKYLDAYLKNKVDNLFVLPVNGSANVIKLFKYLRVPIEDSSERKLVKGKVFLLIDTDAAEPKDKLHYKSSKFGDKVNIKRFTLNKDNSSAKLADVGIGEVYNTVIEDVLDAEVFFDALCNLSKRDDCEKLNEFEDKFELKENSKYSSLTRNIGSLKIKSGESHDLLERMYSILYTDEYKMKLADEYIRLLNENEEVKEPTWLKTIINFFN